MIWLHPGTPCNKQKKIYAKYALQICFPTLKVQQQQQQLLLHLGAEVQTGPTMNTVMMKTTIQAALLTAELVVRITTVNGTPIAQ